MPRYAPSPNIEGVPCRIILSRVTLKSTWKKLISFPEKIAKWRMHKIGAEIAHYGYADQDYDAGEYDTFDSAENRLGWNETNPRELWGIRGGATDITMVIEAWYYASAEEEPREDVPQQPGQP